MADIKKVLQSQKEKRSAELEALLKRVEALEQINNTSENEEELKAAGAELDELNAKKAELEAELAEVNAAIAELDKPAEEQPQRSKLNFMKKEERGVKTMNIEERNAFAQKFVDTKRASYDVTETRAVLVSSGNIATPTEVDGIYDNGFAGVSSIIDLVRVVNCEGMGSNKVAYEVTGSTAANQTEGSAAASSDPTFDFVTITPTSVAVLSSISKQAKKQSPLQYEAKVKESAMLGLRKKAAEIVTAKAVASSLTTPLTISLDQNAIRDIALSYGGDEGIEGAAYLFLNKADLITLGKVRGTQEKKAVFEITPDANPNTGTIKDGGTIVRYCLNKNLTAGTMLYGNPKNIELDLFSNYEIRVSEDFYFDKLMDAIRGDVELGADVIVKDGLVKVTVG